MRTLAATVLVGAISAATAQVAQADVIVDVARATVRMPPGEWVTLSRGRVEAVKVSDHRAIPAEVVALGLVQRGAVDAVVTITATGGGAGRRVTWSTACKPADEGLWATRPRGTSPDDMACVYASAPFPAEDFFTDETAWGRSARVRGLQTPDEVVLASAEVGSRMGALMQVEVLAGRDFIGLPDAAAPADLTPGVDARHAAFALLLAQRLRDCLNSIRGRMDFPPIFFAADAPADRPIAFNAL